MNDAPGKIELHAADLIVGRPAKRRKRKPNIGRMITDAEKAGKKVTSVTQDGVTLALGGAIKNDLNEWDQELEHGKH